MVSHGVPADRWIMTPPASASPAPFTRLAPLRVVGRKSRRVRVVHAVKVEYSLSALMALAVKPRPVYPGKRQDLPSLASRTTATSPLDACSHAGAAQRHITVQPYASLTRATDKSRPPETA